MRRTDALFFQRVMARLKRASALSAVGVLGLWLGVCVVGCGNGHLGATRVDAGDGTAPDPLAGLASITVSPDGAMLVATDAAPATTAFVATGHYKDGTTQDVSKFVTWTLADVGLGSIAGGMFTSTASHGGKSAAVARAGSGASGIAGLGHFTVKYQRQHVLGSDGSTAPADSPKSFATGPNDPSIAPALAYPSDGTLVPTNLGQIEIQWTTPARAADLYEVSLVAETVDLRLYTNAVRPGGGRVVVESADWNTLVGSAAGQSVKISVAARDAADPTHIGASPAAMLGVGRDEVQGGIYYWSATTGANGEGIQRHAFGDNKSAAQPFFTEQDGGKLLGGGTRCVACHVLSRDGTKFAITFDGGDGVAGLLDVATRKAISPPTSHWNFAALSPDASRMVGSSGGVLSIYDTASGAVTGTLAIPDGKMGSHPDWSPDGMHIVYAAIPSGAYVSDWNFTQGSLYLATDLGGGNWQHTPLVVSQGENNYYPSFSPDNQWVLYNRAQGGSYSAQDAHLYVVSTDGKKPPARLMAADGAGDVSNSWPRWSPFVQPGGPDGDLFYFTFSSKRAYGIELAAGRPQIWMAAFSPKSGGELGMGDAYSFAPFWLPYQDPGTSNHIAQWTTTIVGVQ